MYCNAPTMRPYLIRSTLVSWLAVDEDIEHRVGNVLQFFMSILCKLEEMSYD